MSITRSITTRIGCRPAIAALSSSRQRLIQHSHVLQRYHHTRRPMTSRILCNAGSIQKTTGRRFASSGNMKSTNGKSNSIKEVVEPATKEAMSPPSSTSSSSFSQFWKSYLQPKPMPIRWSAAWYREMALLCTVFAITGTSSMVLVS